MDRGRSRRRLLARLVGLAALLLAGRAQAAEPPIVAGAADLRFALEEIARLFEKETGQRVELVLGSSGNLARQIRQGAPFELFLSADEEYALGLARDGLARDEGALYAIGRVVLMVPRGSPLVLDGTLDGLVRGLREGRIRRFAIANPEHAPYGKRAREVLERKGIWKEIEPLAVYGENVAQAAQFVTSGNAQAGIVAYSLARSPQLQAVATHALIPADWHAPLRQRMVLRKGAQPLAERFYDYLQAAPARAILRRYGFVLPGEEAATD